MKFKEFNLVGVKHAAAMAGMALLLAMAPMIAKASPDDLDETTIEVIGAEEHAPNSLDHAVTIPSQDDVKEGDGEHASGDEHAEDDDSNHDSDGQDGMEGESEMDSPDSTESMPDGMSEGMGGGM